jgi:translation initiation factor IF-1
MREETTLGKVIEVLASSRFKVRILDTGKEVICYLAGKIKVRKIKIGLNDTVEVILDPYEGQASNRIVWRR